MPQFPTVYLSDLRPLTGDRIAALYRGGWKRAFDLGLASILLVPVACLVAMIAFWLRFAQGPQVFFLSERIGRDGKAFALLKFRTMHVAEDAGFATGGDKNVRITRQGHWLRGKRLDELPQLWNILKGDLSFVGPRPPLRRYVARHPAVYSQLLRNRPGLTGLATVTFHQREASLLAATGSASETDRLYSRVCVPRKARLDMIYQRNASLMLDLIILWRTLKRN